MTKAPKTEAQLQLEKEVKKNLKRIKQFVRRAEKRGYSFSEKAIPTLPKTITEKTLSYYKSITPEKLYKKAVYVSPQGTKIKASERRKQERKQAAEKAARTRKRWAEVQEYPIELSVSSENEMNMLFQTFVDMFESWTPESWYSEELSKFKQRDRSRALGILNGAREELDDTVVAINIQSNATRLHELANKILYESGNKYREDSRNGEINTALNEMSAILYGRPLSVSESIALTEMSESNESYE